ncbi:MAG TPA: glutamyl-tRNA reductase [Candidatus Binataceae bacterium]|jgi:glutamyl-tRNA reductase|nr:glutamyl-tRNA reductase [Candidatus Binataceae bacterium]
MAQSLLIVGINHRTAAVDLRERLAFREDELVPVLERLKLVAPSVSEAALISTCNRVEMIAVANDPEAAANELIGFLAAERRVEPHLFDDAVYRFEGREAARHLFRVGTSLDSMVIGEPQILGQLKDAYMRAAAAGTVGIVLHRAFHRAFSAAKKVRERTLIGHGTVSVSSAAINLAKQIFDSFEKKTVLLMGAGEMAETTARQLVRLGIESLLITNRTFDRAVALARTLGGTAVPLDSYRPYLKIADVVIGSLTTNRPLLGRDDIEGVLHERKYRPMFLIDLGVPRNFHEGLNQLDNVYLYNIDDLAAVTDDTREEREREAQKAESIVELELESFWRWLSGLELVPAIKDIRANIERLREAELRRHRAWMAALPADQRAHIETLSRGIINKILHQILSELRRNNGVVEGIYAADVARRLLGSDILPDEIKSAATRIRADEDDADD